MSSFLNWMSDHSKQIGIALTIIGGGITIGNALINGYNQKKEMNNTIRNEVTKEIDRRFPPAT